MKLLVALIGVVAIAHADLSHDISESLRRTGNQVYDSSSAAFQHASDWLSGSWKDSKEFLYATKQETPTMLESYLATISAKKDELAASASKQQQEALSRVNDHYATVKAWSEQYGNKASNDFDAMTKSISSSLDGMWADLRYYSAIVQKEGAEKLAEPSARMRALGDEIYASGDKAYHKAAAWVHSIRPDEMLEDSKESAKENVDQMKAYLHELNKNKDKLMKEANDKEKEALKRLDSNYKKVEGWSNSWEKKAEKDWDSFKSEMDGDMKALWSDVEHYKHMVGRGGNSAWSYLVNAMNSAKEWIYSQWNRADELIDASNEKTKENIHHLETYLAMVKDKQQELGKDATDKQKEALKRLDKYQKSVKSWSKQAGKTADKDWEKFKTTVSSSLDDMWSDIQTYKELAKDETMARLKHSKAEL